MIFVKLGLDHVAYSAQHSTVAPIHFRTNILTVVRKVFHRQTPVSPLTFPSATPPPSHCPLVTRTPGVPSDWKALPSGVSIHSSLPTSFRSFLGDTLSLSILFEIVPPSAGTSSLPYPASLFFLSILLIIFLYVASP